MSESKGWHSRGYLPHFDKDGLVQSITFRLHDAVPADVIARWKQELTLLRATKSDISRTEEMLKRIDGFEDDGHGTCVLHDPRAAGLVQNALFHFDDQRYRLLSWCVMPNHVHVLIDTIPGHNVSDVVHSWKSFTANAINRLTGAKGALWMPDYFDRFVRDQAHLEAVVSYIERNPVKAGLVKEPRLWRFSSACLRAGSPRS